MLLCKYRLKKLRRVVLGIRGVGYDLGLGAPEVSIPVTLSGPQLLHHVISRFSFLCDQESKSCFASVLGNWEFFILGSVYFLKYIKHSSEVWSHYCLLDKSFSHGEVFLDLNPAWHIRHYKTHSPWLWNASMYWCWKQQSRVLIPVLYLASHWSHLCPILNIAWLHSYIGSLPYGLEVRYWLYYDVMARFLGTSKSCPAFLPYHRMEQE